MAGLDPEGMARNIGQIQLKAMNNLWTAPGVDAQMSDYNGGGVSPMLLGPYGQALAGQAGLDTQDKAPDPGEYMAMRDLNDLKNSTANAAASFEASKRQAVMKMQQETAAKIAEKNKAANPTTAPASSTGGGVYAGAFPYAEMVKGYLPEEFKNDPEIMKIIAAGSHAESGWDPKKVQPNGGGRGLFQFDINGGMGTGLSEAQLFDPNFQASRIVPKYVDAYRNRAQSGLNDPAQIASWVAAQAERPFDYQNQNSQARKNYVASYQQLGQTPQNPAHENSGAPYQVNRTSQFGLGLNKTEALAFCGPAAALALAQFYGNNIPVEQVRKAAYAVGWNSNQGMAGPQSQVQLLKNLGVNATSGAWNEAQAQQLLGQGTPLIIDTPGHYFVADQYDPRRGYRVGTSGTDLRQGGEWMTPQQMASLAIAGTPRTMIWRQ